jgi:hypothetical protein
METEQSKNSYAIIALKWGLINGITSFVFTVITKYAGLVDSFEETVGWVTTIFSLILTIVILVFTLREYRNSNNDTLAYSMGLGLSTLVGAVTGIISGGFNYIYLAFIDGSSTTQQLEKMREKWEEQGLSQSQMDQAEEMSKMFMGPGVQFVSIVVISIIFFFILGLIVSGIMKREKPIFE